MRRRVQGEGSVFWREDRRRWVAQVSLPGGKTRTHYAKTRREAEHWRAETVRAAQQGILPTGPAVTCEHYFTRWLSDVAKPRVKLKTLDTYTYLLTKHAIPALGKTKLAKLQAADLQALYAAKLESGLSARTVTHLARVLHAALQDAVRWDYIARNPADLARPPRAAKPEVRFLNDEDLVRFLRAARGDRFYCLYLLAATTAMREGELLALFWSDIDFEERSLQVQRTVWYRAREKRFIFTDPKSATSRRRVDLMDVAVEALRRRREEQQAHKLLAGEAWEGTHPLVFTDECGRPLKPDNFYRSSYKKLLKVAGVPDVDFHALRRSLATALLAQGEHVKVVSELLGHSTVTLTLSTYSGVLPTLQRQALERQQRRLSMIDSLTEDTLPQGVSEA